MPAIAPRVDIDFAVLGRTVFPQVVLRRKHNRRISF